MAREIQLLEDRLHVRYSAPAALLTTKRELSVPYSEIDRVEVGLERFPSVWAFRVGLADPVTKRFRGRFWTRAGELFLDVKGRERAVVLHLRPESGFQMVALTVDDPERLADDIRNRVLPATTRPLGDVNLDQPVLDDDGKGVYG